MEKNEIKKLKEDLQYAINKFNWGASALDAKALDILNTYEERFDLLTTPSVRGEEIENIKRRAVLDYILSLGWQDLNDWHTSEVLEDADKLARELSPQTTEGESK